MTVKVAAKVRQHPLTNSNHMEDGCKAIEGLEQQKHSLEAELLDLSHTFYSYERSIQQQQAKKVQLEHQIRQLDEARSDLRRQIYITTTEEDTRREKIRTELIDLQTKTLSAQLALRHLEDRQAHLIDSLASQRTAKQLFSNRKERSCHVSIRSYPVYISDTEDEEM